MMLATINEIMDSPSRKIYAKIKITYSDSEIDTSIDPTALATQAYTHLEQTANNLIVPDQKWFGIDDNVLDGTYYALPSTQSQEVGWWSVDISDGSGEFSIPYPQLKFEFTERTMTRLKLDGDEILNNYPVDFTFKLYDSTDTLLHTETVTGNTEVHWETTLSPFVTGVKYYTVDILKINKANSAVKLLNAFVTIFQEYVGDMTGIGGTYDGELIDFSLLEELEYFSGDIPIGAISANEIDVTIDNSTHDFDLENTDSPIFGLLKRKRKIEPYLGVIDPDTSTVIWEKLGKFWSIQWDVKDQQLYSSVTGRDTLELMRTTRYTTSIVYEDYTLYDLFEVVLDDFISQVGLSLSYDIDTSLQSIVIPYAWFDRTTHREALRLLASSAQVNVYVGRDELIHVEVVTPTPTVQYTFDPAKNYFSKSNPYAWADITNSIEIKVYEYQEDSSTTVYTSTETITVPAGGTVTKIFNFDTLPCKSVQAPVITADVDVSVQSYTNYAWGQVVIFQNVGGSDGDVTSVSIDAVPIIVKNVTTVSDSDTGLVDTDGEILSTLDSRFIQNVSYAETLASNLLTTYKNSRQDVTFEARGHITLTLGDLVDIQGDLREYMISRQDILWDGGLSATIETKFQE